MDGIELQQQLAQCDLKPALIVASSKEIPLISSVRTMIEVLGMARQLNLVTVAEGIETEADLHLLQSYGCRLGQGYLFSPAISGMELPDWFGKNAGRLHRQVRTT